MAEITGVFATSHAPPLVRDWDDIEASRRSGLAGAFAELGRRIRDSGADTMIVIGADHWANFFLDNLPAICIGVGSEHGGPPEKWLSGYPHVMAGHPALAMHIAATAFGSEFEPSISHRMKLDHAFCVPLWKAGLERLPRIVPIVINAIQEPLPSVARCVSFGRVLASAIESFPGSDKVAVLASGGLSHSVGEPTMGDIDEAFDRECIELFRLGRTAELVSFLTEERMQEAGNGAGEIRFWAAAHGAAGGGGFELIHYQAVPETYTGCGFAEWKLSSKALTSFV